MGPAIKSFYNVRYAEFQGALTHLPVAHALIKIFVPKDADALIVLLKILGIVLKLFLFSNMENPSLFIYLHEFASTQIILNI